jgi:hypothetical protein
MYPWENLWHRISFLLTNIWRRSRCCDILITYHKANYRLYQRIREWYGIGLYKKLLSNLKNMPTLRYNVNCIYYYYYNRCISVCSPLWHRGQSLFFLTSRSKSIPHFLQIRRSCTISVCLNLHIIIIIIIVRM